MDTENLKLLLDLGGQAVLLFILYQVWQRLNVVTDKLIDITNELRIQNLQARYTPQLPKDKSQ